MYGRKCSIMLGMAKRKKTAFNPWPARLKKIREDKDMTQAEAAEIVGTVLRTWQNWEYGRSRPSPMIAKLIDLLFGSK